jgi:hypothetical protein
MGVPGAYQLSRDGACTVDRQRKSSFPIALTADRGRVPFIPIRQNGQNLHKPSLLFPRK